MSEIKTPPIFQGAYMGMKCRVEQGAIILRSTMSTGVFETSRECFVAMWNRLAWIDEAERLRQEYLCYVHNCRAKDATLQAHRKAKGNSDLWKSSK